jgi:PEGA domain
MARALVFAAGLVLASVFASAGGAVAGVRTSKVTIETDPPGAKVYFNLKEDGEVCTTPCTVDAPIGETPLIIEAENRRAIIENLVVPKKTTRPMKVSFKLEAALGTLVVEGGAGATIKIDDEDHGKAPRRLDDLQAGAHHVVLEKNGKKIYDDFVEIEIGHEATVTPSVASATPAPNPLDDVPAITTTQAAATAPGAPHAPAIAVTVAVDAGFRQFTYKNNQTPQSQRDDTESGQVLIGPIVEVWPTTLLGLDYLHGLSLYGRFQLGVNNQAVSIKDTQSGMSGSTALTTSWRSLEISAHQRWVIADNATVEVGAGYTDDRYEFEGGVMGGVNASIVPDAAYQAVRIGGRASLRFGAFEPFLTLENRLVLDGGAMEQRYRLGTSVNGVRGSLGVTRRVAEHFELRLEAGLTLYSWTFRPDTADPMAPKADGGRDFIQNVTLALGYTYF